MRCQETYGIVSPPSIGLNMDGFRDRNQRYGYLVACENARRIRHDAAVMMLGIRHLERFSRGDAHQRDGYALWQTLFNAGPAAVADRLTERSPRGDYARETVPSFGGLPNALRTQLLREALVPLAPRLADFPKSEDVEA